MEERKEKREKSQLKFKILLALIEHRERHAAKTDDNIKLGWSKYALMKKIKITKSKLFDIMIVDLINKKYVRFEEQQLKGKDEKVFSENGTW